MPRIRQWLYRTFFEKDFPSNSNLRRRSEEALRDLAAERSEKTGLAARLAEAETSRDEALAVINSPEGIIEPLRRQMGELTERAAYLQEEVQAYDSLTNEAGENYAKLQRDSLAQADELERRIAIMQLSSTIAKYALNRSTVEYAGLQATLESQIGAERIAAVQDRTNYLAEKERLQTRITNLERQISDQRIHSDRAQERYAGQLATLTQELTRARNAIPGAARASAYNSQDYSARVPLLEIAILSLTGGVAEHPLINDYATFFESNPILVVGSHPREPGIDIYQNIIGFPVQYQSLSELQAHGYTPQKVSYVVALNNQNSSSSRRFVAELVDRLTTLYSGVPCIFVHDLKAPSVLGALSQIYSSPTTITPLPNNPAAT